MVLVLIELYHFCEYSKKVSDIFKACFLAKRKVEQGIKYHINEQVLYKAYNTDRLLKI